MLLSPWGCCGNLSGGMESLCIREVWTQLLAARLFAAFDFFGELLREGICALYTAAVTFCARTAFLSFTRRKDHWWCIFLSAAGAPYDIRRLTVSPCSLNGTAAMLVLWWFVCSGEDETGSRGCFTNVVLDHCFWINILSICWIARVVT